MPVMKEDKREVFRLAGETNVDPRTVKKWLARKPVMWSIAQSLEKAARRLGIERQPAEG